MAAAASGSHFNAGHPLGDSELAWIYTVPRHQQATEKHFEPLPSHPLDGAGDNVHAQAPKNDHDGNNADGNGSDAARSLYEATALACMSAAQRYAAYAAVLLTVNGTPVPTSVGGAMVAFDDAYACFLLNELDNVSAKKNGAATNANVAATAEDDDDAVHGAAAATAAAQHVAGHTSAAPPEAFAAGPAAATSPVVSEGTVATELDLHGIGLHDPPQTSWLYNDSNWLLQQPVHFAPPLSEYGLGGGHSPEGGVRVGPLLDDSAYADPSAYAVANVEAFNKTIHSSGPESDVEHHEHMSPVTQVDISNWFNVLHI